MRTGEIISLPEDLEKSELMMKENKLVPLTKEEVNILEPMSKVKRKNWMRNRPCVCGSKKKFKVCCWGYYK